jgi:hypothetical protein
MLSAFFLYYARDNHWFAFIEERRSSPPTASRAEPWNGHASVGAIIAGPNVSLRATVSRATLCVGAANSHSSSSCRIPWMELKTRNLRLDDMDMYKAWRTSGHIHGNILFRQRRQADFYTITRVEITRIVKKEEHVDGVLLVLDHTRTCRYRAEDKRGEILSREKRSWQNTRGIDLASSIAPL